MEEKNVFENENLEKQPEQQEESIDAEATLGSQEEATDAETTLEPKAKENETQSAPQQQSDGRLVNNTAGSHGYVPNGMSYQPQNNTKKRSKVGVVVGVIAVCLVFFLLIGSVGIYGAYRFFKYAGITSVNNNNSTIKNDSSVYIAEEISVPQIVDIAPVPDESYESLIELYNNAVKSCVTILCTVDYDGGFFTQEVESLGSGFIVEGEKDGKKGFYIITNHHVVEDAKTIEVKYYDGETRTAKLIGSDELCDIAVLETDRKDVTPIEFGDSNQLAVGQWVVAIGTPSAEELMNTMSYGIVSGINRRLPITNDSGTIVKTMTVIQTTATLNPGNSGGPLINMAGQVVGINAMKLMKEYEGIGFALPSTEASNIVNSLIQYGKVVSGSSGFVTGSAQLGITGATVTDEIREYYSLGEDCPDGVLVVNVNRGTSVYQAGLSIFDIITELNDVKITTIKQLKEVLSECNAGDTVSLKFYRIGRTNENAEYHTISFTLDKAN